MFNYLRLFIVIAISCIITACTEPDNISPPIQEPEPPLPTEPFVLSENGPHMKS